MPTRFQACYNPIPAHEHNFSLFVRFKQNQSFVLRFAGLGIAGNQLYLIRSCFITPAIKFP